MRNIRNVLVMTVTLRGNHTVVNMNERLPPSVNLLAPELFFLNLAHPVYKCE